MTDFPRFPQKPPPALTAPGEDVPAPPRLYVVRGAGLLRPRCILPFPDRSPSAASHMHRAGDGLSDPGPVPPDAA